jgi:hypothetical protein
MLSKLREILLTQYIGSILIGLLVWQATIEVVSVIVRTGFWAYNHSRQESVLGRPTEALYRWDNLIFTAVTTALYLLTAYGLASWLYPTAVAAQSEVEDEEPSEEPEV